MILRIYIVYLISFNFPTIYCESLLNSLPENETQALSLADKVMTYKTIGNISLKLYIFTPKNLTKVEKRPAILFIHGGAWAAGSPAVHAFESLYFSKRGFVTATISYRLLKKGARTPLDCFDDAKSAIQYLRKYANQLNIDTNRIICSGSSAGGHLAASLANVHYITTANEPNSISYRPNALILLYPAFDLINGWMGGRKKCEKAGIDVPSFSPAQLVNSETPPTVILSGAEDPISTTHSNNAFIQLMKKHHNSALFIEFEGRGHKLFERNKNDPHFRSVIYHIETFLKQQNYINEILSQPISLKINSYSSRQ